MVTVRPAYADGREDSLTVLRLQNDRYQLSGTGAVPPAFLITDGEGSRLSLATGSDPRVTLANRTLQIDPVGLTGTVTANVQVQYGADFLVQMTYPAN